MEQGILQLFVGRWNENQEQCSLVKVVDSKLAEEETILKISEQIKTDNGIGRIGLTDKRLENIFVSSFMFCNAVLPKAETSFML